MNEEQFLAKSAFDDIIASLEALLLEVQTLVASVDPLNDPAVIADIQTVADQLAEILTVAGISGDITTVAGESANIAIIAENITQIQSLVDELQAILAVAADLTAIQTVADDTVAVNTVAGSIAAVQEVADNMQAVIDAVQAAQDAEQARDDAQTWAEGDDPAVELLGGTHSAKTWAEISEQHTREGIRFLGTVADLDNLPESPDDGDAYFYAETVGDNAIGYGVVWSEAEQDWSIFQMGATLVPGTMLPDQEASPAAANQTTFGGFSASPEMSLVMINRIEQEQDTYTFDGNQIVFSEGLKAGDIVRVRQWRRNVSFEDLPEVESLSAEDKIPVQTSQGSGVVSPISLFDGVYSNYRVEDLLLLPWFETTTGDSSVSQLRSLYSYVEALGGEEPGSEVSILAGYRQGYRNMPNDNTPMGAERIFYVNFRLDLHEDAIFRFNTVRFDGRMLPLAARGWGLEIRDGRRVFLQLYDSSLTEIDTGLVLNDFSSRVSWRIHYDPANEKLTLHDRYDNSLIGEINTGSPTGFDTLITANCYMSNNNVADANNLFRVQEIKHLIEVF